MRQIMHNLDALRAMDRAINAVSLRTPEPPSHWYEMLIAIVFLTIVIGACVVKHNAAHKMHADHIEEDDPRWDCHTMGNKICGTKGGK